MVYEYVWLEIEYYEWKKLLYLFGSCEPIKNYNDFW